MHRAPYNGHPCIVVSTQKLSVEFHIFVVERIKLVHVDVHRWQALEIRCSSLRWPCQWRCGILLIQRVNSRAIIEDLGSAEVIVVVFNGGVEVVGIFSVDHRTQCVASHDVLQCIPLLCSHARGDSKISSTRDPCNNHGSIVFLRCPHGTAIAILEPTREDMPVRTFAILCIDNTHTIASHLFAKPNIDRVHTRLESHAAPV
mmetsp:Transcript_20560/g.39765  ORF Transcript_20560/g.39765 Transcript_20560/m.39765 type:complete len:202 (+) Transcript_20560:340-945(+)